MAKKKNKVAFLILFLIIGIVGYLAIAQTMFPGDINCPGYDSESQQMIMGLLSGSGEGFEILPNTEYCITVANPSCSKFIGRPEVPTSLITPYQFPISTTKDQVLCDRVGVVSVNNYHQITICDIDPTKIDYTGKTWSFQYRAWEQGILPQPTEAYFKDAGKSMCFKFNKYQTGFQGTIYYNLNSTAKKLMPTPSTGLTGDTEACGAWSECSFDNTVNSYYQQRYCYVNNIKKAEVISCTPGITEEPAYICGNLKCEPQETYNNCPGDCTTLPAEQNATSETPSQDDIILPTPSEVDYPVPIVVELKKSFWEQYKILISIIIVLILLVILFYTLLK